MLCFDVQKFCKNRINLLRDLGISLSQWHNILRSSHFLFRFLGKRQKNTSKKSLGQTIEKKAIQMAEFQEKIAKQKKLFLGKVFSFPIFRRSLGATGWSSFGFDLENKK